MHSEILVKFADLNFICSLGNRRNGGELYSNHLRHANDGNLHRTVWRERTKMFVCGDIFLWLCFDSSGWQVSNSEYASTRENTHKISMTMIAYDASTSNWFDCTEKCAQWKPNGIDSYEKTLKSDQYLCWKFLRSKQSNENEIGLPQHTMGPSAVVRTNRSHPEYFVRDVRLYCCRDGCFCWRKSHTRSSIPISCECRLSNAFKND